MNKAIKEIRQKLKLTQEEFAKKIGVSVVTVSKYENGITSPTKQKMALIENLLNNCNTATKTTQTVNDSIPLALADFKPVIPTELYEKLDCDVDEYMTQNMSSIRRSPAIKQFAEFSYFYEVLGEAMAPDLIPTDVLALKILPRPFKIMNGDVYVINTRYGMIVRMLYQSGENYVAKAFNPRFSEIPIMASDIYNIYKVVGLIRRNI